MTRLEIISDVVCPWCYLGAANLMRALGAGDDPHPFALRWRPYQLDPTLPPEGMDRAAYMAAKFGDTRRLDGAHARLEAMGADSGISFRFDRIARSPNTPRRPPADPLGRGRGPADPHRDGALRPLLQPRRGHLRPGRPARRRRGGRHGPRRRRAPARRRRRPRRGPRRGRRRRRAWASPACRRSSSAAATRSPAPSPSRSGRASSARSRPRRRRPDRRDDLPALRPRRPPRPRHRLQPGHRPRAGRRPRRPWRRGRAERPRRRQARRRRGPRPGREHRSLRRHRPRRRRRRRGAHRARPRPDRHPRQQRRHAVPRAARGLPDRQVAAAPRHQCLEPLLRRPGGRPRA